MSWCDLFESRESALCIGLDPVPDRLPAGLGSLAFCRHVIDATADYAACYKPNVAFFERNGPAGMEDYARLIEEIRQHGFPVIADVKRGDVASTSEAYAAAYFGGPFDADAITVNPSVGLDAIEPFRAAASELGRGVLLLLRTSNPGAAPFQAAAEPHLVEALRGDTTYGAVVGATDPETGARLRAALPDTFFLVPGFGAQGGKDLDAFFDARGRGAVVSASRSIIYAEEGHGDWLNRIHHAAEAAHARIEEARKR